MASNDPSCVLFRLGAPPLSPEMEQLDTFFTDTMSDGGAEEKICNAFYGSVFGLGSSNLSQDEIHGIRGLDDEVTQRIKEFAQLVALMNPPHREAAPRVESPKSPEIDSLCEGVFRIVHCVGHRARQLKALKRIKEWAELCQPPQWVPVSRIGGVGRLRVTRQFIIGDGAPLERASAETPHGVFIKKVPSGTQSRWFVKFN